MMGVVSLHAQLGSMAALRSTSHTQPPAEHPGINGDGGGGGGDGGGEGGLEGDGGCDGGGEGVHSGTE